MTVTINISSAPLCAIRQIWDLAEGLKAAFPDVRINLEIDL